MARLPIGKDHNARAQLAQDTRDLDAVFECVFDCAVGQVERFTPAHAEEMRCFSGLASAFRGCAARSRFTLGEVENSGAQAARCHPQEGAATCLLHVVAVSGNRQHIDGVQIGRSGHQYTVLFASVMESMYATSQAVPLTVTYWLLIAEPSVVL
jgi:hypothetical protein